MTQHTIETTYRDAIDVVFSSQQNNTTIEELYTELNNNTILKELYIELDKKKLFAIESIERNFFNIAKHETEECIYIQKRIYRTINEIYRYL